MCVLMSAAVTAYDRQTPPIQSPEKQVCNMQFNAVDA